jgi:acetyl esterase/lipase
MICGSALLYDPVVSAYVEASGVPMLSVEYRLAPEHPHPVPVEDAYAGLRWLVAHASELGVDPRRIAVMGDSAGGGLAAGVALLARERGKVLCRQILIYPMLDDRTVAADPALVPFASWTYDDNFTGWHALLGDRMVAGRVPAIAAPSRALDLTGLASAYVEVGELDIFRDEDIDYARRLAAAGVSAELHVLPGAPHGFDRIAPESGVAKRSMADRVRVLKSL